MKTEGRPLVCIIFQTEVKSPDLRKSSLIFIYSKNILDSRIEISENYVAQTSEGRNGGISFSVYVWLQQLNLE